jgi:hypothetical protein
MPCAVPDIGKFTCANTLLEPLGGSAIVPLGGDDPLGDDEEGVDVGEEEVSETVGLADGSVPLLDEASLFVIGENAMQSTPISTSTNPTGPVTVIPKGP